jgi:hypothetical protein
MQIESEVVLTDFEMELCPYDITAWGKFASGSGLNQNICRQSHHVCSTIQKLCWTLYAAGVIFNVSNILKAGTAFLVSRLGCHYSKP